VQSHAWKRCFIAVGLIVVAGACGSSGKHETAPSTTRAPISSATTLAGVPTSGPRTILSPIGVRVRAAAKKTAPVVGTAGWGSVLTVLGYTAADGGWFEVRGAAHTGWITGDPTLSAAGEFLSYNSNLFSALYPPTWTHKPSRSVDVVFMSSSGADMIAATTATAPSHLTRGRTGYGEANSRSMVVCGVTGDLVTYTLASASSTTGGGGTHPAPYLLQIRLILDAHHVLSFEADLSSLGAPLQTFSNFLESVTFPFRQCIG
jgi:hypothetical protein